MAVTKPPDDSNPGGHRRRKEPEHPEDELLKRIFRRDIPPEELERIKKGVRRLIDDFKNQLRFQEKVFFLPSTEPKDRLTALAVLTQEEWKFPGGKEEKKRLVGGLMGEYNKTGDVSLKAGLMNSLIILGVESPEVQDMMMADLASDKTDARVLEKGLDAINYHLIRGTPAFADSYEGRLKGILKGIIMRSDDIEVLSRAANCLATSFACGVEDKPGSRGAKMWIPPEELKGDEELIGRLRALRALGDKVLTSTADVVLGDLGAPPGPAAEAVRVVKRTLPMLDEREKTELAERISKADEPAEYLGRVFRRSSIVFVGIKDPLREPPQHIVETVLRLNREGKLTHLALPYSRAQEEDLEKALAGRRSEDWIWGLAGREIINTPDVKGRILSLTLDALRRMRDGGVEFLHYGSVYDRRRSGELFMDARTRPLLDALEKIDTLEKGGKILALGEIDYTAMIDTSDPARWQERSLPVWLKKKKIGIQTASIIYQTADATESDMDHGTNNLSEALRMAAARTDRRAFGMPIEDPLSKLLYDPLTKATYEKAWGGIVLEAGPDRRGTQEETPTAPTGERRTLEKMTLVRT
jgi:hypothetical protein